MKRLILLIILVAVVVGGVFAYQRYRRQKQAEAISSLETVPAGLGDLTASVGATGVVRANQTALLVWGTSGRVEAVNVKAGDQVEAGQVLASLEKSSLAQNIILAEADLINAQKSLKELKEPVTQLALDQAQQAIKDAQAAVIEAERAAGRFTGREYKDRLDRAEDLVEDEQEQLESAQENFDRYKDREPGDWARQHHQDILNQAQLEYDEAVHQRDLLKLQPEQAQAALAVARAQLAEAQSQYEELQAGADPEEIQALEARIAAAEATLKLARLDAPFAGTITTVQINPGDQVSLGAPAFRVDDLSRLLVDVNVSEVDINRVRFAQDVSLTFDAIPGKEYHGKVIDVARVGENVQGVVEFIITVELTNADEEIRPGLTAAVNIIVDQLEEVLLVPNRAVRVEEGKRVVYVMHNNQPEPVQITLGASSDTFSQVLDGDLKEGDPIILNPPVDFSRGGGPGFMR